MNAVGSRCRYRKWDHGGIFLYRRVQHIREQALFICVVYMDCTDGAPSMMKDTLFMIASLAASVALNSHGQAAAGQTVDEGSDQVRTDHKEFSPPGNTNGSAVIWQYGAPTLRTNKFNPVLPASLPPPAPDKFASGTNPLARGTAQVNLETNPPHALFSPVEGSNAFTATVPEPVVWQFGAPTRHTNKFNPLLPANLPPPVSDKAAAGTNPSERDTNPAAASLNKDGPASALSPPSGTNGESVIWQYGKPTSRSNSLNPLLPTNLPPPAPTEKKL
jgi:hypothetical protein